MSEPKLVVRYRDARTGKYCTKEYAIANPDTTVREVEERRTTSCNPS